MQNLCIYYYHKGQLSFYKNNYLEAIDELKMAYSIADSIQMDVWKMEVSSQLNRVYFKIRNYSRNTGNIKFSLFFKNHFRKTILKIYIFRK